MASNENKGLIEQGLLFGLGVVSLATEKAGQVFGGVLNTSNLSSDDGKKMVHQAVDKTKSEVMRITDILRDSASKIYYEGELGKYYEFIMKGSTARSNKKH